MCAQSLSRVVFGHLVLAAAACGGPGGEQQHGSLRSLTDGRVAAEDSIELALDSVKQVLGSEARATLVSFGDLNFSAGPFPFFAATINRSEYSQLSALRHVRSIRVLDSLTAIAGRSIEGGALESRDPAPLTGTTQLIGAADCWDHGLNGTGATVVVIDYGIDDSQSKFLDSSGQSRVVESGRFIGAGLTPDLVDIEFGSGGQYGLPLQLGWGGHGTRVAAVIAGYDRNAGPENNSGVAPNANLISLRVTGETGEAHPYDIAIALAYVASVLANSYDIAAVNLSLALPPVANQLPSGSCDDDNRLLWAAVQFVLSRGIPVITGTGNDSIHNGITGPSCLTNTVAVAGSTDFDLAWTYSNRGPMMNLFAPSSSIRIGTTTGFGVEVDGTSYSAAYLSGALALLGPCRNSSEPFEPLRRILEPSTPTLILNTPRLAVFQAALELGCVTRTPETSQIKALGY